MSLRLPSTATDEEFFFMPPNQRVVEDDEEWEKYGKWMLIYPENDLSWADKVWTDLQVLLSNGSLPLLKASTAAFKGTGVILCYTRPGREAARKAAEVIREVVHYEYMMYHKSNKKTYEGIASRFGDKNFSQYMHTFRGGFYVKDAIHRWKFVDTRNDSRNSRRNDEASPAAANIPLELQILPSSAVVLDLNRCSETDVAAGRELSKGHFHFNCNLQRGEDGLVESDCVWSAVKSLYDDGDFIRIRRKVEKKNIYIYCHVTDYSDLQILVNIAKHIFRTTRFPSIIYFDIETSVKKHILKYVFTPQGEVYEELGTGPRKFIFNFEIES